MRVQPEESEDDVVDNDLILQDDAEAASKQWRQVADQLRPKVPKLAAFMDVAEADVLAFMSFTKDHRPKIHSTDEIDKQFFVNGRLCGNRLRSILLFGHAASILLSRPPICSRRAQGQSRLAASAATTGSALTAPSTVAR